MGFYVRDLLTPPRAAQAGTGTGILALSQVQVALHQLAGAVGRGALLLQLHEVLLAKHLQRSLLKAAVRRDLQGFVVSGLGYIYIGALVTRIGFRV